MAVQPNPLAKAKLRIARPTNDLDALLPFYCTGLGFHVLYRFQDHDGFDGVMLGLDGAMYHLEFTKAHGHIVAPALSGDDLLVFYLPEQHAWQAANARMHAAGFGPVHAFNPYWDRHGRTFEDPDGYRIVLQHAGWNA